MPKIPNTLVQFIKDERNRPYGCLVAHRINGPKPFVRIGISLCNTRSDSFNKKIGFEMALKRCVSEEKYTIHASGLKDHNDGLGGIFWRIDNINAVAKQLFWFMERASRYFKDTLVTYPSNMIIV